MSHDLICEPEYSWIHHARINFYRGIYFLNVRTVHGIKYEGFDTLRKAKLFFARWYMTGAKWKQEQPPQKN